MSRLAGFDQTIDHSLMIPAIYIITNKRHGTLYTGVTSNLVLRIHQHKTFATKGFAEKYRCNRLVYYEILDTMIEAILREKQIKAGSRARKIALIEKSNPKWTDLYTTLF